jgi:hypothetical protein
MNIDCPFIIFKASAFFGMRDEEKDCKYFRKGLKWVPADRYIFPEFLTESCIIDIR